MSKLYKGGVVENVKAMPSKGDPTLSGTAKAGSAQAICAVHCKPNWFTKGIKFRDRTYTAADLNMMARVVYGEASGSGAPYPADKITQERETVAAVISNRFNAHPEIGTVWEIVNRENQFAAVSTDGQNGKFLRSGPAKAGSLVTAECADLNKALAAVCSYMKSSKRPGYSDFLRYENKIPKGWTQIGGTIFH